MSSLSRRRSACECIVRSAASGNPAKLYPAQLRHLASMPCIREAAAAEEALLDARPAPAGFSVDGWVGHLARTESPNEGAA